MKLEELIEIINKGYPDDKITEAYFRLMLPGSNNENIEIGDDLAVFIVREIMETFAPGKNKHDQLTAARRVMDTAQKEIGEVIEKIDASMFIIVHYENYYACANCGEHWVDVRDCMCNDKCPDCNKEIEPYFSKELSNEED
jgi:hypothetical protein